MSAPIPRPAAAREERGMALILGVLILTLLSTLALLMMASVRSETHLTSLSVQEAEALSYAMAGIEEAKARIARGDIPDNSNPNQVSMIFNAPAGSVPTLGPDSTALETGQPAGSWLPYSVASRGPDVLTVKYKTNAANQILRYDRSTTPRIQATSGKPIFAVNSTARAGRARRTLVVEFAQRPFNVNIRAALAANVPIDFVGNAYICGYNHDGDTPYDDGKDGRPAPFPPDPTHCQDNEVGSRHLPGAWSTAGIGGAGASGASGSPAPYTPNQTGFYAGPWEVLTMSQSEFYAWLGGRSNSQPTSWEGVYHWDNNSTTQDRSANLALHSANGEGFLYVDGDLRLNAGFHYRGLIYVEGDLEINGQAWVLGGIIVSGRTRIKATGGMTILYSSDAITRALTKFRGRFVTLSWREE